MSMPLEGIRIIEWGAWLQGPLAASLLGDLGAEVIKIEDRVTGDPQRGQQTLSATMGGMKVPDSFVFSVLNRNKKSITVDITKEEGREVVYGLVGKSDVFLQNFRPGVAEKVRLDYDTLSKYNPKLIYAHGSGLGPEGPQRGEPALDYMLFARSGMMTMLGEPDMPPICYAPGTALADHVAAITLAYGVVVGLLARDRLGISQEISTSGLGSMVALQTLNVGTTLSLGQPYPRTKRSKPGNPLWNHYMCGDGKWLALGAMQSDRYWHDFCQVLGLQELENAPKFNDMTVRAQNTEELVRILDRVFATKPRDEWLRLLTNRDIICGPVNTMVDVVQDPQVLANDYVVEYDHPTLGRIKTVGFPLGLSQTPATIRLPSPEFGQHTEEVLGDILGYSWEKIASLKDKEVI